jgi:glucuronoarabinoxylan endo-1,4-beta-xylanase
MTTDGLMWAGIIDDRLVNENASAYLYWWLIGEGNTDDQGLESSTGSIAQRAYVFGQYSKFIRPGYYRIDATHIPQSGVSVSAYQNTGTKTLVIVATNYTGSAVSQGFSITNAPTFSSVTPYSTSTSLSLAAQTSVPVSANSFTYKLPAGSVTTFVGTGAVVVQPPTNVRAHPF